MMNHIECLVVLQLMGHKTALKSFARYIIIGFSEIATLALFSTWMEAMKLFSVFVLKQIHECACVCMQKDDIHTLKILQ